MSVNAAANVRVDFNVHRNGDIGSPRESGSTRSSRQTNRSGSTSINSGRPPPSARTACIGSRRPGIVARLGRPSPCCAYIPDTLAAIVTPPRPSIRAIAPACNRRCFSSRCGPMNEKNSTRPSSDTPTPKPYPTHHRKRAESSLSCPKVSWHGSGGESGGGAE